MLASQLIHRHPRLAVGVAAAAVLMTLGASRADDRAAGRDESAIDSIAQLVADDTLDPRIVALDLDGAGWRAAVDTLDGVLFAQRDAERRIALTIEALRTDRADLATVERELLAARTQARTADDRIEEHREILAARAVALFVGFGDEEQLDELDSIEDATTGARTRQLAAEVDERQLELLADLESQRDRLGPVITDLAARQVSLETRIASLEIALVTAHDDAARADAALPDAIDRVRSARRSAEIPGLDLSVVALDAYLRAEVSLGASDPGCRIEWWMIAGVGRVESRHGEIGGRSIRADGRPDRDIIGIALDGGPGVRAITDTDDGALDGDTEWDRAVGPMQFIPETWSIRGRDGNGDAVQDPHNLYDAALAAGRYLCRLGGDVSDIENLREAYFGYNTSSYYVAWVERHALRYRDAGVVGPAPVSD